MDRKSLLAAVGIEIDDAVSAPAPTPTPASASRATAPTPSYHATAGMISSQDQVEVDKMNTKIFTGPSNYTLFRDFHAQIGGNDVAKTLKLLMSANPSITADKIRADIKTALNSVQQQRSGFEQFIEQSKKEKIQGPESEIARLTSEISQHQAEIAHLTAAISAAQTKITTNQTQKLQNEQAINDGAAHFNAVIQAVEKPLLDAQSVFSNI